MLVRAPRYGAEDVWEELGKRRERPATPRRGLTAEEWEPALHELLQEPLPCPVVGEFASVWQDTRATLAREGVDGGRGAFGGWDDGDPALARAAWCLVRHLRPRCVLETGIARGVSSRTVLEACARNGDGHLWSIDLAPLLAPELAAQVGMLVPAPLHERWTRVDGSTRHRLPAVLDELGEVDLFIHDSLHTERNVRFELESVWPRIRSGGAMIVDDIQMNAGFETWERGADDASSIVCVPDDGRALFAIVVKRGGAAPA